MPLSKRSPIAAAPAAVAGPTYESLVDELTGGDVAQRRAAARGLAQYPHAAPALCAAVTPESHESVREAIFTALIRLGTSEAAAGLLPLLAGEDVALRNGAIEALKSMPAAVDAAMDELMTKNTDVRIFAVEIMGGIAHLGSCQRLVKVIQSEPEVNVCAAAVDALAECGDSSAVGALRALLERFPNEPFLDFSVRTALARIADA